MFTPVFISKMATREKIVNYSTLCKLKDVVHLKFVRK